MPDPSEHATLRQQAVVGQHAQTVDPLGALVETDQVVENRAQAICAIQGALFRSLGDRKVDILLKDSRTTEAAVFRIAKEKGATL